MIARNVSASCHNYDSVFSYLGSVRVAVGVPGGSRGHGRSFLEGVPPFVARRGPYAAAGAGFCLAEHPNEGWREQVGRRRSSSLDLIERRVVKVWEKFDADKG